MDSVQRNFQRNKKEKKKEMKSFKVPFTAKALLENKTHFCLNDSKETTAIQRWFLIQ